MLSVGLTFLLCAFMVGRVKRRACAGFRGNHPSELLARDARGASCGREFRVRPGSNARVRNLLARLESATGTCRPPWRSRRFLSRTEWLDPLAIGAYVALRGLRPLMASLAGLAPGALLLGAYDWAAFGAPWHLSYRYVANSMPVHRTAASSGSGFRTVSGSSRFRREERPARRVSGARVGGLRARVAWSNPTGRGTGRCDRDRDLLAQQRRLLRSLWGRISRASGSRRGATVPRTRPRTGVFRTSSSDAGSRRPLGDPDDGVDARMAHRRTCQDGVWGELARVPVELDSARFVKSSCRTSSLVGPGPEWGALLVAVLRRRSVRRRGSCHAMGEDPRETPRRFRAAEMRRPARSWRLRPPPAWSSQRTSSR